MDRAQKFASLIAAFVFTGMLTVACDSGTQEPDAPDNPMPTISVEDVEANQALVDAIPESRFPTDLADGVSAAIPDSLPKDLPIYPGSAPAQGKGVELDGKPMAAVQLLTVDPPEKVFGYYLDQLNSQGWEIDDDKTNSEKNAISASKGECEATLLIAPSADGGSDIFMVSEC